MSAYPDFVVALGVGVASGLVPVVNVEAYLVGVSLLTPGDPPWILALAAGVGQVAGKLVYYYAARGSLRLPAFFRRFLPAIPHPGGEVGGEADPDGAGDRDGETGAGRVRAPAAVPATAAAGGTPGGGAPAERTPAKGTPAGWTAAGGAPEEQTSAGGPPTRRRGEAAPPEATPSEGARRSRTPTGAIRGRVGAAVARWSARSARRVGRWRARAERRPRWCMAVLAMSAFAGLPPFGVMSAIAGGIRLRVTAYLLIGVPARCARFWLLLLAPGVVTDTLGYLGVR